MDAFDNGDPDSSQATQMIQDLLERDNSPGKRTDSRSSALKTQNNHSNEISSDSLPSSRTSHSIPQYHFHGLASTQTQSQHHGDDDEPEEGSQKENIGAAKPNKDSSPMRPNSPQASSSRNIVAKAPPVERRGTAAAGTSEKATSKRLANVTFQSPRPKVGIAAGPTKPNTRQNAYKVPAPVPSRYKAPPRPPARTSSQDSFANEPENNEQFFVAKADQFVLPLSELGGSSSPPRDLDTTTSGASTSRNSMYNYSRSTRQPVLRSPPRGIVLVESTPSNSSQSQSQSQEDERPTVHERFQEGQSHYPLDNDNYSNSYDRPTEFQASPPEIHPDLLATQPSTQPSVPADFQATQPSTQLDDFYIPEPEEPARPESREDPDELVDLAIRTMPPPRARTATTNPSAPQSLVSMVPEYVRHRYRIYANVQNSAPSGQNESGPLNQIIQTSVVAQSDFQETQPSLPEAPLPRRGFPSKSLTSYTNASAPSEAHMDSMEIVPDSEPSRLGKLRSPVKALFQQPKQIQPAVPAASSPVQRKVPATDKDVQMRPVNEVDAEMEEEEEEEEEEVPLAKVAMAPPAKRSRGRPPGSCKKGINSKGKEREVPLTNAVAQGKSKAQPAKPAQKPVVVPAKTTAKTNHGRSWETTEVPSSMPEQDVPKNTRGMRNRPTIIAAPKKQPDLKQSSSSTSQYHQHEQDADEDPRNEHDRDEGTELADEEYQDENEAGPSRKRKRIDKADAPVKNIRAGTAKRSKRVGATPGTRSNIKIMQSVTSTRGSQGSRVFALWTQDGHYYPGIVHSTDNNHSRYNIKFDDGTEAWVNIDDIRICELHVGDDVLFGDRNRPAKIVNVDGLKDRKIKVGVDGKVHEKATSDLRIAHKTILFAWADRKLTPQTISTTVKPVKKQLSPSPSKMSMVSVPTMRGNRQKVLSNTALIVTLAAVNGSYEKEKDNVMNAVRNTGGIVIDDLSTIIRMEGKLWASNNRWTITKSDVKWIGSEDIQRLFLVADDINQKPKYLMALALGIPCLSTTWLQESVEAGKEKDWLGFMLPQGYSDALKARPSQQVDVDWGNSIHQLTDIMNNAVACKLYAGKSILFVGLDMANPPKGKRRAGAEEKALESSTTLPRIILAMGAEVVEAVTEARHASQPLANYDCLVIRDADQYNPEYAQCTTVHWPYVKQCLLASRHLPLPEWPKEEIEEDYSQEA